MCVRAYARVYRVSLGTSEVKRPLGRPRLDGRITIRWIFRNCDGENGLIWLRIGTVGGHL